MKPKVCDLLGIKYPIIQAGMGPFSNNNLCVAATNAGVLGLLSTSGLFNKEDQPWIYNAFVDSGEAVQRITDMPKVSDMLEKVIKEAEETLRKIPNKYLG
jgi:hypothetical protein